jgi:hypothetical protein
MEKDNFISFIQKYLDSNDSIPSNERLYNIFIHHKYYRHEFMTSRNFFLQAPVEFDEPKNRYRVKDIILLKDY